MTMLREISGDETLLERFTDSYQRAGGFPLDISYARRCQAFAFFDGEGAMIGGFLINTSLPFRALEDMADEARERVLARLDLDQTFEGMCLWLEPSVRGRPLAMRFWASVLFTLWRFPRENMLTCTVSRGLKRLYMSVPVEVLYEGKIETPSRLFDKYVLLSRGKRGYLRGVMIETSRRLVRAARSAVLGEAPRPAAEGPSAVAAAAE